MIGYEDRSKIATRALVDEAPYHRPTYHFFKRTLDVVVSLLALVILLPLFIVVTVLVGITSGWPATFRQKRIGHRGEIFEIIKFRSMVKNAEEILRSRPELLEEYRKNFKIENDPRISKLGGFLRKSTIDELPQLFNVLKGEMTLVGPRPIVPPELEKYGDSQDMYLAMKPGCTGLWQCSGRSATTYEERVALDREYFEKASVWFDIQILFKTVKAVCTARGAK